MTIGVIADSGRNGSELANTASYVTGEQGMEMYTGGRSSPTHDEIAELAFRLYELRGRQDGHDVDDWFQAEHELVRHYA